MKRVILWIVAVMIFHAVASYGIEDYHIWQNWLAAVVIMIAGFIDAELSKK